VVHFSGRPAQSIHSIANVTRPSFCSAVLCIRLHDNKLLLLLLPLLRGNIMIISRQLISIHLRRMWPSVSGPLLSLSRFDLQSSSAISQSPAANADRQQVTSNRDITSLITCSASGRHGLAPHTSYQPNIDHQLGSYAGARAHRGEMLRSTAGPQGSGRIYDVTPTSRVFPTVIN